MTSAEPELLLLSSPSLPCPDKKLTPDDGLPFFKVAPFAYGDLSIEHAAVARRAAEAIRNVASKHQAEIGRHLLEAKQVLPHGAFQRWAATELEMKPRTAERYMTAARFLEGKSDTMSQLPPTIVYRLASPKADRETVEMVVAAAQQGQPLPVTKVRALLDHADDEAKELSRIARCMPKASPQKVKKRRAEEIADRLKRNAEYHAQKASDELRLSPLVDRVARKLLDEAEELVPVFCGYNGDRGIFEDLLGRALLKFLTPEKFPLIRSRLDRAW